MAKREKKKIELVYHELNEYLLSRIRNGKMTLFADCTVTVGHKQYFEAFLLFDESTGVRKIDSYKGDFLVGKQNAMLKDPACREKKIKLYDAFKTT